MAILQSGITKSLAVSYDIDYSCRFDAVRNTYLSDTPGSDGSKRKFTVSAWVKLGGTDTSVGASGNKYRSILLRGFGADDDNNTTIDIWSTLDFFCRVSNSSTNYGNIRTDAVLRDYSSWYHVVVAIDTEQAASGDRCKLYINGVLQTEFSANVIIAEDQDIPFWAVTTTSRQIGRYLEGASSGTGSQSFDNAYIAEYYYIDGAQLAASVFGETNEDTNQWVPIDNSDVQDAVTFGTLGFYLDFADSSDLGKDVSGQGNHFASSGFTANDQMIDTPTNNFCTLNPLFKYWGGSSVMDVMTFSEGNLKTAASGGYGFALGSIAPSSGKWYFEVSGMTDAQTTIGAWDIDNLTGSGDSFQTLKNYRYYGSNGIVYDKDGGTVATYSTYGVGDVIGCAIDLDNNKIFFAKNNTWEGSSDPAAGTNPLATDITGAWVPACTADTSQSVKINFGQDSSFSGSETAQGNQDGNGVGDFYYAPPSGFLALCTANLSDPEIVLPGDYFNTVLYTGTGSARSITGVGFQPDFVWLKNAGQTDGHKLYDSVRGFDSGWGEALSSNIPDAQVDYSEGLSSFDSDGFSIGTLTDINSNTYEIASWNWKAGGVPTATNSAGAGAVPTAGSVKIDGSNLGSALAGTIPATKLSASTTSGISLIEYTGTAANGTVAHGLSVTPKLLIFKVKGSSTVWYVNDTDVSETSTRHLQLEDTSSLGGAYSGYWNSADPTASIINLGPYSNLNSSGSNMIWCFHSVEGYSKVGTYVGNSTTDGPFIYTGFRIGFLMVKLITASSGYWVMFDNKRDPDNPTDRVFYANEASISTDVSSYTPYDLLSNGFKSRIPGGDGNEASYNSSGETYIYLAFAESPFKYSNAR